MKRDVMRLLCVAVVLSVATASPAAAEDELRLSLDGVTWVDSISDPLFDPSLRWVPGDSHTETFFVRNHGGSSGDMTVDLTGSQSDALLDSGDLHITARGGGGEWTTVSQGGTHRLLTAPDFADESVEPIAVTVTFDESSTNQTQLLAAELTFRITLSESAFGSGTDGGAVGNGGGLLPGTGAAELRWIAALGAIALGAGLALVRRRRADDLEEAHV